MGKPRTIRLQQQEVNPNNDSIYLSSLTNDSTEEHSFALW